MKASLYCRRLAAWILLAAAAPGYFLGNDTNSAGQATPSRTEQLRAWIADWSEPSFSTRRTATQNLEAAGIEAFDLLAEAAIAQQPETTHRALAILEQGLRQPNAAMQDAAHRSIKLIAESSNPSAARAAQQLLREVDNQVKYSRTTTTAAARLNGNGVPPLGLPIPRIVTGAQVTIRNLDSSIQIQIDATGRIRMEITRRKDGQQTTEKIQAANEVELRANHPQAHREYAKYAQGLHRMRLTPPGQWGNIPPRNLLAQQQQDSLRRLIAQMDDSSARLRDQLSRTTDQRQAESLRASLQRTQEQKAQLLDILMRTR